MTVRISAIFLFGVTSSLMALVSIDPASHVDAFFSQIWQSGKRLGSPFACIPPDLE